MEELDDAIVESARKGDAKAFRQLYDHYDPLVWSVAYKTVGGERERAQRVVQDVFVRAWESLKTFRGEAKLSTWLFRIAYNTAMNRAVERKRFFQRFSSRDVDSLYSSSGSVERESGNRDLVVKILATLSPQDRFLLTAREAAGLSFEQLADVTGQNEGALRVRVHRLKETVRRSFSHEYA